MFNHRLQKTLDSVICVYCTRKLLIFPLIGGFNSGGPVQTPLESGSAGVPCWGLWGKPPVGLGPSLGFPADLCSLCFRVSGQRSVRYVPGWRAV